MPHSAATFSDRQKLREFITTTPGQEEMFMGVLQGKMKEQQTVTWSHTAK